MTKTTKGLKRCKTCKKAEKNCVCVNELAVVEFKSMAAYAEIEENIVVEAVVEENKAIDLAVEIFEIAKNEIDPEFGVQLEEDGMVVLKGSKKIVAVRVTEDGNFNVLTLLNKFAENPAMARNILKLKSLKAVKSYMNCHAK